MSEFKVSIRDLNATISEYGSLSSLLSQASQSVSGVKRSLQLQIAQRERINARLTACAGSLSGYRDSVNRLRAAGETVISLYQSTEEKLAGEGSGSPFSKFLEDLGLPDVVDRITELLRDFYKNPRLPGFPSLGDLVGAIAGAAAGYVGATLNGGESKKGFGFGSPLEGSALNGEIGMEGEILGFSAGGSASGSLLNGSLKMKGVLGAKFDEKSGELDELGVGVGIKGEGHLASGKLEGHIGYAKGEVEGNVGNISASGEIGATLYEDGKLQPQIKAELKGEVSAAEGSAELQFGSDDFNRHVKASGKVLGAEAGVKGGVGFIEDKDGKKVFGVQAEASAEAYLAEGEVSGGITLFGIKIDASISGKAGGAGVKAGGSATASGVSGEIGAGLGLGLGLKLSIDWSDFKLPKWPW